MKKMKTNISKTMIVGREASAIKEFYCVWNSLIALSGRVSVHNPPVSQSLASQFSYHYAQSHCSEKGMEVAASYTKVVLDLLVIYSISVPIFNMCNNQAKRTLLPPSYCKKVFFCLLDIRFHCQ